MRLPATASPCLAAAALLAALPAAHATENGNQEYPVGVNTVLPGLQPPPGETEYLNYLQFYDIGSSVGPTGRKDAPGFHVDVVANAFRVEHTWAAVGEAFGGTFALTSGLVVPLVASSVRVAGISGSDTTLGDIDLQTLYLDWVNQAHTLFTFGGLDIYVPSGHYNPHDLVNIGLNYTTFMPNGGITWFASKRLQLSLFSSVQVNTTNQATHYHSGASLDFDWDIDYNPFPRVPQLFFGVQGYAFQQFEDDTVKGMTFEQGNEGRALGIGPQIRYDFKGGGVALKYQHEFAVENRGKGERFWLQFAIPLGL